MNKTDNHFMINEEHPCFDGHFPNNPIVPGVVILDHVMLTFHKTSQFKIQSIDFAKFINPVKPNMLCNIEFSQSKSKNKVDFVVTHKDLIISKGRLLHD